MKGEKVPSTRSIRTASPAASTPSLTCASSAASTLASTVITTLFSSGSTAHAMPVTLADVSIVSLT